MYWLVVFVRLLLGLGQGDGRPRNKHDRMAIAARVDGRFVQWRLTDGPVGKWLQWWSGIRRWFFPDDPDDTARFDSPASRRKRRT